MFSKLKQIKYVEKIEKIINEYFQKKLLKVSNLTKKTIKIIN